MRAVLYGPPNWLVEKFSSEDRRMFGFWTIVLATVGAMFFGREVLYVTVLSILRRVLLLGLKGRRRGTGSRDRGRQGRLPNRVLPVRQPHRGKRWRTVCRCSSTDDHTTGEARSWHKSVCGSPLAVPLRGEAGTSAAAHR
jgi:hypothetical protein